MFGIDQHDMMRGGMGTENIVCDFSFVNFRENQMVHMRYDARIVVNIHS